MKRHYLFDAGIAQDYQAGRGGIRERAIANPIITEAREFKHASQSRARSKYVPATSRK
jgi:hypothetical protein